MQNCGCPKGFDPLAGPYCDAHEHASYLVQRGSKTFRIINYWEAGCRCRSWHEINQSLELYRAAIYCEKHQPIASNGAGLN
jgi:hypothetical protein